jgi:hypothetical protein
LGWPLNTHRPNRSTRGTKFSDIAYPPVGTAQATGARRLLADCGPREPTTARAAGEAPEPTPAWCRQATGCSAGTSVKVAAALHDGDSTSVSADQPKENLPRTATVGRRCR